MKSHLVHILPVWEACEILGEPVVRRMVRSLLRMRQNSAAGSSSSFSSSSNKGAGGAGGEQPSEQYYDFEEDVNILTMSLFYRHPPLDNRAAPLPAEVAHAWKRWLSARNLAFDKPALIQFVVPQTVQPHAGPSGHMGLFDCWVYALQGHATTSTNAYYNSNPNSTLVWFPDVLILLAAAKQYVDFVEKPQRAIAGSQPVDKMKQISLSERMNSSSSEQSQPNPQEEEKDDDEEEKQSQEQSESRSTLNTLSRKSAIAEATRVREEMGDMQRIMGDDEDAEDGMDDPSQPTDTETYAASTNNRAPSHTTARRISVLSLASDRAQRTVKTMSRLAFRIYDSYQKKGSVTRDTIHRFLTDVHGEDSYKEEGTRSLLDDIFDDMNLPIGDLHAAVADAQFVGRVVETFDYERRSHLLLDWLSYLLVGMIPPPEIPPSVTAYLDTMEHRPKPLCEIYQITESRLFEVRRRFHSMVRAGPSVIHGDPMGSDSGGSEGATGSSANSSHTTQAHQPKQSISLSAFLDAVCRPNQELGHGGYLPESLANLVFAAGASNNHMLIGGGTGGGSPIASTVSMMSGDGHIGGCGASDDDESSQIFWGLANLIQFGCMAVRQHITHPHDQDIALMRFLFFLFSIASNKYDDLATAYDDRAAPRVLEREQVERMLVLMIEHTEFRLRADSPPDQTEVDDRGDFLSKEEGVMVEVEIAFMLGILPNDIVNMPSKDCPSSVPLTKLVDYALESTKDGSRMTFDEFCAWNTSTPDGGASRLSPIFMDLRLIASVLFGVPPTMASLEIKLIAEIERRHKERHPQTSVSRRGPRGTIWYIIDAEWLRAWAQRVQEVAGTEEDADDGRTEVKGGVRGLGRIENAALLTNSTLALRQDIQWKHDYEILPPLAWQGLQAWYDGGPPIHRSVVRYIDTSSKGQSMHSNPHSPKNRMPTENEIELYPYFVTVYLCDSTSGGEARPFQQNYQLSRVSPVGVMLVQLCKELEVDPARARLWVLGLTPDGAVDEEGTRDWIVSLELNIVDQRKSRLDPVQIKKDIHLLLELKNRDTGKWPRGEDGKEWIMRRSSKTSSVGPIASEANLGDGIVGLYNMGNTCFLNSSIQCISHTPIFREYFTSKAYLNDINTTNPLGYQGHLAQVSAVLINSLWKPFNQNTLAATRTKRVTAPGSYVMVNAQSLTPKTFKESLGKFNEHFSGNEQHDAQELLTFLLAGLSEDLNRIVEKPYTEAPDSDGRPDRELADIWWSNHLKRELSIVVALFNGQYKNLLTCRTCKYESARFEPFSTLTVPLPEDDSVTVSVILYPFSEKREPMRYCVRVRGSGNLGDVLLVLAKQVLADREKSVATKGDATQNSKAQETPKQPNHSGQDESEQGEKEKVEKPDTRVARKAQNLSIVDMRDGYIFRIAPLNWALRDLQNKETGDLPTMHAYELDELEDADEEPEVSDKPSDKEKKNEDEKPKAGFLAVSQRRTDLVYREYLHPLTHKLFGTPVLIRLKEMDYCTGRQLYDLVAKRLRPLVPKAIHRFLEGEPTNSQELAESLSGSEEDEKVVDEINERRASSGMTMSTSDSEDVSAGPVPRYGFRLRVTSRDGRKCLICPWYKCCVGCLISDDESLANVMDGDSLVVDWHFAVDVATLGFGSRAGLLDPIAARGSGAGMRLPRPIGTVSVKTHRSCGIGGKGSHAGAITLEKCLEAFAKEERIPEAYCSKCKDFRVQTTRMTLWRLPPILIIHLKRFQFTTTMRRKLRDLVVFPLEGLDLSSIMAPDGAQSEGIGKVPAKDLEKENTDDDRTETTADSNSSFSTAATNNNDSNNPKDSSKLYDLYGVIHHQGALSGGHYVASLKSEIDNQWRLFNDAQIYEIHARDVIDASAYILFYMRRDVAKSRLSDFWDLKQVASISEEEMDNLVKGKADRCVIS
ncbi:hypothetical protein ACA910_018505 [Epithemia clementina (nom. ined.)]